MRLRASRADSAQMHFLEVSGNVMPVMVRAVGSDSMTFELPFLTYRASVGPEGRIGTLYQPNGVRVERLPSLDINALAARWDSLDRQGRAMGMLSPLDSSTANIGPAKIAVIYSRPSMRGREVWGRLVPWGEVWRTGANAATVLRTDRNLLIGGRPVPAGAYALFTVSTPTSTTLIIGKETMRDGRPLAGTAFDPAHELTRVEMTMSEAPAPVEQLTIAVEPGADNRGTLVLAWDRRRLTVPVVVQ
jgi:hypothetical protein